MPVRSDHSSQMAANCAAAKQEPRCLQPIQPVQAVDCIAVSSTVFGCPAPVATARPICHCWCDSSAVCHLRLCSRTAFPVFSAAAPLHAIHLRPTSCVRARGRSLLPSVRFACIRYSVSLLQPTPTLPLIEICALPPPPFATSTPLQHLSSHRASAIYSALRVNVALASADMSRTKPRNRTPSIQVFHIASTLQRATASFNEAIPELRTAFD